MQVSVPAYPVWLIYKLISFHPSLFLLLQFPSRKPSTVISEPIQSTIGNSLNSSSIGGQTTEKGSEILLTLYNCTKLFVYVNYFL